MKRLLSTVAMVTPLTGAQNITELIKQLDSESLNQMARGKGTDQVIELNSCEIGAHECPEFAECHTLINWAHEVFYKCKCKSGFAEQAADQAAGVRCIDIDECQEDPCKENEKCKNLTGSYECRAKNDVAKKKGVGERTYEPNPTTQRPSQTAQQYGGNEKLQKLRSRARKDCSSYVNSALDCDPVKSKAEKFVHRLDKVLDDAVWHLTGAKKCRAANQIGKWAPPAGLYRKRRVADYSLDYSYDTDYASDEYGENYYSESAYSSDEYGSDEYGSDEYDSKKLSGRKDDLTEEERMLKLNEDEREFMPTETDVEVTTEGFEPKYISNENACRNALDAFWAHQGISLCGKVGSWKRRSVGLLGQIESHARSCDSYIPVTTTAASKPSKPNKKPGKKPGKYGK